MMNVKGMKSLSFLFLIMNAQVIMAAQQDFFSCKTIKFPSESKILHLNTEGNTKTSMHKMYFIKNSSEESLLLNHPQGKDPHAGAGWASSLKPNHWSALLLSAKDFALSCSTLKANKMTQLDCKKVINICEPNIHLLSSKAGSYWFVENKVWKGFYKAVSARLKKREV